MAIFLDIKYYISLSLPERRRLDLSVLLDANGATAVPLQDATHVVSNSHQFEGWQTVAGDKDVVTDKWVDRSIVLGRLLPPQYYSTDPTMLFSGVVAAVDELSDSDTEVIYAGIAALGGQFRSALTRDVTHLLALGPGSPRYETALHHQGATGMKILLPHWFDDSIKLGMRGLPTEPYEWPEPRYLDPGEGEQVDPTKSLVREERKRLLKSSSWVEIPGEEINVETVQVPETDIWSGRKVLISPSLRLRGGRREAVEAGIQRTGGVVLGLPENSQDPEEEASLVDETDVLVTKYRAGPAYIKAYKASKTIGTLAWLFYVQSTGTLSRPTDQLLHFPIPIKPIIGFENHEITITNYTGETRDYLKKLVVAMGGKWTPNMSLRNTVVIAGYTPSQKTTRAYAWGIPVVNHTWLEDCFLQWRNLSVGHEKYVNFPPGVDFGATLGLRGVGKVDLLKHALEAAEEESEEVVGGESEPELEPELEPRGTGVSERERNEVENAVSVFDGDGGEDGEDGMEVAENPEKLKTPERPKPKWTSRAIRELLADDEEDEVPMPRSSPRKSVQKRRAGGDEDEEDLVEGTSRRVEEELLSAAKTSVKRGRGRPRKDGSAPQKPTASARARRRSTPTSDEEDKDQEVEDVEIVEEPLPSESEPELEPEPTRRKVPSRVSKGENAFERRPPHSANTVPETSPAKSNKSGRGGGAPRLIDPINSLEAGTPPRSRQALEVLVPLPSLTPLTSPTRRDEHEDEEEVEQTTSKTKTKPTKRKSGGRPPGIPARESIRSSSPAPEVEAEVPGRSRRAAATKAAKQLKETVMPDLMNYEAERKRWGKGWTGEEEREQEKEKDSEKTKVKKKGKRKEGEETEQEKEKETKKDKGKGKERERESLGPANANGKKKRKSSTVEVEDEGQGSEREGKRRKVGDERETSEEVSAFEWEKKSTTNPKSVKLVTTQVTLADDVIKALKQLGVTMSNKPSGCTHIVPKCLARTEKLLCAMANAPYVLTEEWAVKSAEAGFLLRESDYFLQDPSTEARYGFTLPEALARAEQNRGKLFAGVMFYATPKVEAVDLLVRVVQANGGKLVLKSPTARTLAGGPNRFVVSCPEDKAVWATLVREEVKIYSREVVLTGALRQEVGWDEEGFLVEGSRE